MKACPAIIAALPREIKALVKGWEQRTLSDRVFVYTNGEAVAACAGMGAARAAIAVRAALDAMPVTALISVGLAGGCDPALRVGEIVRAGVVVDERTDDRFENSRVDQVLVSTGAIASVQEKARLRASYDADAVDMEAAAVARLAREHELEFQAIKAISDEAGFEVEGLARFSTEDGRFREMAFALYTAVRPTQWKQVATLGRNSSKAVDALTAALNAELDWYKNQS